MYLKRLLKGIIEDRLIINHFVNNITDDSKEVQKNDIYVCIDGYTFDGHDFMMEAIKKGCKTIICKTFIKKIEGINFIKVSDTKKIYALLLKKYNKKYLRKVKIIGVTGTSGKTTTSSIISEALLYNGINNILIGSNGIKINNNIIKTNNTTPNIRIIYECIKKANIHKIKYIIMEVSSQSIKELRSYYLDYEVGIFTNLYNEHLDYHKTMEDYFYTKLLFLNKCKKVIINKDSKYYQLVNQYCKDIKTFSINTNSDLKASLITHSLDEGMNFKINYLGKKYKAKTYLIGDFNIYNILASFLSISNLIKIEDFIRFLNIYYRIDGRMNFYNFKGLTFLIDYAHTSNEVWSVLKTVKEYTNKRLILVIGCGGNRDISKRPEIGRISTSLTDYVIFTNDNPRYEDDKKIIKDILSGVRNDNYEVILDRYEAIKRAISISTNKEIIIILGKGIEDYQIINNIKYEFNDLEAVKKIMEV